MKIQEAKKINNEISLIFGELKLTWSFKIHFILNETIFKYFNKSKTNNTTTHNDNKKRRK